MVGQKMRIAGAMVTMALLVGALSLYNTRPGQGSDHQDSPAVVNRPGADITDVYVFPPPNANRDSKVVLVMDVYPLITHAQLGSTSFDPAVMYQFKVAHGASSVEDQVIQFSASGSGTSQVITMYGPGTPKVTGTSSVFLSPVGSTQLDTSSTLPGGIQFFAGHRADPFFFDLAQFFKIIPDRNYANHPTVPPPTATSFRGFSAAFNSLHGTACDLSPSNDILSSNGFNVLTLVVEIPRTLLTTTSPLIHVWATTSTTTGS